MADSTSLATSLEFDSGGSDQNDRDSTLGDYDTTSIRTQSVTSSVYKYRFEDGRRYHAYEDGRYMLPNDESEQDRLDLQHHLFRLTADGSLNLAPLPKDLHNVLDVGCGTGIWAIQFADEHPSATVLGVDLSPIQPNAVPPNCSFRVDNIEADWVADEKYDFIHSRAMIGAFKDWPGFFKQAFDHLNPGGYIELQDMCFPGSCVEPDLAQTSHHMKWTIHSLEAAASIGADLAAPLSWPDQLRAAGFVDIHVKWFNWPVGQWAKQQRNKVIGQGTLLNFSDGVASSQALFTRILGWSLDEFNILVAEVRKEQLAQKIHLYQRICFCYASKPEESLQDNVRPSTPEMAADATVGAEV